MTLAESILPNIQKAYPPEEWGEAWLCAVKEEARYDVAKATCHFWPYFTTKFAFHKIDRHRAETGRFKRGRTPTRAMLNRRLMSQAKRLCNPRVHESLLVDDKPVDDDTGETILARLQVEDASLIGRPGVGRKSGAHLYDTARMVASGMSIAQIAASLGVCTASIGNYKRAMRSLINSPGFAITEPVKCA